MTTTNKDKELEEEIKNWGVGSKLVIDLINRKVQQARQELIKKIEKIDRYILEITSNKTINRKKSNIGNIIYFDELKQKLKELEK